MTLIARKLSNKDIVLIVDNIYPTYLLALLLSGYIKQKNKLSIFTFTNSATRVHYIHYSSLLFFIISNKFTYMMPDQDNNYCIYFTAVLKQVKLNIVITWQLYAVINIYCL